MATTNPSSVGWDAARGALDVIVARQDTARRNTGRYLEADELVRLLAGLPQPDLPVCVEVSADGREWWAWQEAYPGRWLGCAGLDGASVQWTFDSMTAPAGGPTEDERWISASER